MPPSPLGSHNHSQTHLKLSNLKFWFGCGVGGYACFVAETHILVKQNHDTDNTKTMKSIPISPLVPKTFLLLETITVLGIWEPNTNQNLNLHLCLWWG